MSNIHEFAGQLGRWIRNQCGLWEHGTDKCVADIVTEYKAGKLKSYYLDDNLFSHPDIPTYSEKPTDGEVDHTLAHPDNCSAVIVEAVLNKLDPKYGR